MTNKEKFINQIAQSAAKLAQDLNRHSEIDWDEQYAKLDFRNEDEVMDLAAKYVQLFLAQELQFSLTKSMLKP